MDMSCLENSGKSHQIYGNRRVATLDRLINEHEVVVSSTLLSYDHCSASVRDELWGIDIGIILYCASFFSVDIRQF